MARPNPLQKLKDGKALCAATFPNFVETWNYIVDFVANLRGEGDDDTSKKLTLDRSDETHPVIRGGGGGDIAIVSGQNSNVVVSTSEVEGVKTYAVDVYYV